MEDRRKILSIARTKDIFIKPFNKSVNTQGPSGQNTRIEKRFFERFGVIFLKTPPLPLKPIPLPLRKPPFRSNRPCGEHLDARNEARLSWPRHSSQQGRKTCGAR